MGQRLKLLQGTVVVLVLSGIGVVISVAIGQRLVQAFQESVILGIIAALFFLMCLLLAVGCAVAAGPDLLDVFLGRVRSADGPIKVRKDQTTASRPERPIPASDHDAIRFAYHIEVADHGFAIGQALFDELAGASGSLRVYFAAFSAELLSLELLEPTPAG